MNFEYTFPDNWDNMDEDERQAYFWEMRERWHWYLQQEAAWEQSEKERRQRQKDRFQYK